MSNKTSDKNVGSIEDDVKRCNELIKVEHANWIGISNQLAISHILAEREQMIVEKKKYTIRLTDEQYRKVIENAQMDTSNDTVVAHRFAVMQQQINEKDKQIQELETKLEFKEYGDLDNLQFEEYMNQFVPKQAIIDLIENKTINISDFECVAIEDIQELLGGEK